MEIKEMQEQYVKLMNDFNEEKNYEKDKRDMILHLIEEVGELAREANNEHMYWKKDFDKENFSGELVDVLVQLFQIADRYGVDIEEVFKKKMIRWKTRFNTK